MRCTQENLLPLENDNIINKKEKQNKRARVFSANQSVLIQIGNEKSTGSVRED